MIVICPHCKERTEESDWREGEGYCEDCGSHAGVFCPECDEFVWDFPPLDQYYEN